MKLWLAVEAIANQVLLGGDYGVRFALVFRQFADELQYQGDIFDGGETDLQHRAILKE